MIVARALESNGVPDSPTRVLGLRRDNGTINSVGSERYGAMGRKLSLYAETGVSEGFSTEWMLSVSPSSEFCSCGVCGNTNWQVSQVPAAMIGSVH
jgi:hypothetical protein